ncbi:MAG: diaminopimelate decarboxylase [Thermomicrobiales bacterium]
MIDAVNREALTDIWPMGTTRNEQGELLIGNVAVSMIALEYGTPTYIYDATTIRTTARRFREAFSSAYPKSRVVYAGKAFLTISLVGMLRDEGLGLDVVSGGELYLGLAAGMPPHEISFHGNNKSRQELIEAIAAGIGKIVIDNEHEIDLLADVTRECDAPVTVLLRLNPGVDVHTHEKISTGMSDSKFGLPIVNGQAAHAVARIAAIPALHLVGYHAHVGSQLFDPQATVDAIDELLTFAADMRAQHGVELEHLSPGGGFGIAYETSDQPLALESWAQTIGHAVRTGCEERGLRLPMLTVEPGRAIVGPAGVALYEVGASKPLPGIRTYISVDGGMADNIRPSLYDARYSAALANRISPAGDGEQTVTIAGKFCESGDILIEDIALPELHPGDLLAIPAAGAYCLAMASNYNLALKPAIVLVEKGAHRLIRRRETYADLLRLDLP